MTVVSTLEVLINGNNSGLRGSLNESDSLIGGFAARLGGSLTSIGSGMTALGREISIAVAPIALALTAGAKSAMDFEEGITNIRSLTGETTAQFQAMADQIKAIGDNSRYGRQGAVDAAYDIASAVADESKWMSILTASINTAQAGNADLTATTDAVISAMNAYNFTADKASYVSDVLTRTVQLGVGTMDDFARALPTVTTLAAQTGQALGDIGADAAFLTVKGLSADTATTSLRQAIVSILNPSQNMIDLMAKAGITSGSAALQMYGLAGTFDKLRAAAGSTDEFTQSIGDIRAIQAGLILSEPEFAQFFQTFQNGLQGATAAAEGIQLGSTAAQFDLLKSQISALAEEVGEALLPSLNNLFTTVKPIIESIKDWVMQNPQVVTTIAEIVAVLVPLGAGLIIAGQAISAVGTLVTGLGGAFTFLISPIGLAIAAGAALVAAYLTNFGGVRDFIDTQVRPRLEQFFGLLAQAWTLIKPGLQQIADWFTKTALPAAVGFITGSVVPAVQNLFGYLGQVWALVGPELLHIGAWFLTDILPHIVNFVTTTVLPAVQSFFNFVGQVWQAVSPALGKLADWFLTSALPSMIGFVNNTVLPGITALVNVLAGIWNTVKPALDSLFNWFQTTFLSIVGFVDNFTNSINQALTALGLLNSQSGVWSGGAGGSWSGGAGGSGQGSGGAGFGFSVTPGTHSAPSSLVTKGDTTINIMMPAEALRSPSAARQRGSDFGDEILQKMRQHG